MNTNNIDELLLNIKSEISRLGFTPSSSKNPNFKKFEFSKTDSNLLLKLKNINE